MFDACVPIVRCKKRLRRGSVGLIVAGDLEDA